MINSLFMCAALALSPDQFDSPNQSTETPQTNQWVGEVYFSIAPSYNVDDPLSPKVAVVKLCSGSHMPTTANNFGSLGTQHSCIYLPLTPEELGEMRNRIKAWLDNPYINDLIYMKSVQ